MQAGNQSRGNKVRTRLPAGRLLCLPFDFWIFIVLKKKKTRKNRFKVLESFPLNIVKNDQIKYSRLVNMQKKRHKNTLWVALKLHSSKLSLLNKCFHSQVVSFILYKEKLFINTK